MSGIRILLVDDNPSARALLAAFVEETPGLELCGEAGDGWQGLELTGRLGPDLVLLDLIMPGLDGIGFLEGLACRLGADYYLVKPVNLRMLAQRISALFPAGEPRQEYGPAGWLLLRLGADSRLDGYGQTAFALELMAAAEAQIQMKEIYLSTARAFHTTAACVEKNMRTVIRGIHTAGSPAYSALLGSLRADRPPGNGAFLRRAAEELAEKERRNRK